MNFNWETNWKANLFKYPNMVVGKGDAQIYSVVCQRYIKLCLVLQPLLVEHTQKNYSMPKFMNSL